MKTKINNLKKYLVTAMVVASSFFVVNAVTNDELVTVSHASGDVFGTFTDLDLKFSGNNGNLSMTSSTTGDASNALNAFIKLIKWLCLGGSIALLGIFVLNIIKMGTAGTNVQARAAAQQGLIWSGISTALLTISTTIFFFIQKSMKV